jgi:hypothetical protein
MQLKKGSVISQISLLFFICSFNTSSSAQMITGVWKGKINKKKAEVKLIQKGDSLVGTCYYYESETNYRRYSIKGYFDPNTHEGIWWDDQLLEEKTGKLSLNTPGKIPYLSSADFNCPGSDKMMLEGDAALKNKRESIQGPVVLEKTNETLFPDEWDFIIENYTLGANDPYYIDSVSSIASTPVIVPVEKTTQQIENTAENKEPVKLSDRVVNVDPVQVVPVQKTEPKQLSVKKTIEEEFKTREKIIATDIPITGDSIELNFYDNAEIDGDSI